MAAEQLHGEYNINTPFMLAPKNQQVKKVT